MLPWNGWVTSGMDTVTPRATVHTGGGGGRPFLRSHTAWQQEGQTQRTAHLDPALAEEVGSGVEHVGSVGGVVVGVGGVVVGFDNL